MPGVLIHLYWDLAVRTQGHLSPCMDLGTILADDELRHSGSTLTSIWKKTLNKFHEFLFGGCISMETMKPGSPVL